MITLQERVHDVKPPQDWRLNKLHHVFTVRKNNKNTGMLNDNLLSLSYGRIINKDIDTTGGLLPESFETYQIVSPGDIVMRLTDLQNDKRSIRQGLVKEKGIITSAYDAVYPAKDHDSRYWAYALLAMDLAKYYYSMGGGVRQSIKFKDFPNDWLHTPPYETQKEIADFLDRETARIDQLIEKKTMFHERLKERLSSKITEYILGSNSDYSDYDRQNVDELWIKSIPSHWEVRKIKMISPVMRGASPRPIDDPVYFDDDGEYAWVRISDVTKSKGYLEFTEQKLSVLGASKSVKLDIGKLFLSIAGSVGKPCLTKIKACIHDGFVYFPMLPKETQKYLYYIFVSGECFYGLGKLGTQLNLNTQTVGDIKIPFPPVEEQEIIAKKLDEVTVAQELIIQKNLVSIEQLNNLKIALITEAVTGQLDIQKWRQRGSTDHRLDKIEKDMEQNKKASA